MDLEIIFFGQLCDITGTDRLTLPGITDVKGLKEALQKRYPAFISRKYIIAVDKKVVEDNMQLHEKNTVALLPPYSGG